MSCGIRDEINIYSLIIGVGSTVWFNTLKNFYNTGYIPGATNTNYGGPPQYVSGIYEKTHDFFDCAWLSGPGRQCRQLLNVTDIQNIIMTVENDRTAFPNSPYPDGNQVVAFFLSPSIAES